MFAAVSMYRMKPGHYEEMQAIATRGPNLVKSAKGCIGATYYTDKEKDEYGSTTIWESKEDYEAFRNSIPPETMERLRAWSREPYVLHTYHDVFTSTGM
jgi:heme-degrading monooxygenase HmoA